MNAQRPCRAVVPRPRDEGGRQIKTILSDMLDQNVGPTVISSPEPTTPFPILNSPSSLRARISHPEITSVILPNRARHHNKTRFVTES